MTAVIIVEFRPSKSLRIDQFVPGENAWCLDHSPAVGKCIEFVKVGSVVLLSGIIIVGGSSSPHDIAKVSGTHLDSGTLRAEETCYSRDCRLPLVWFQGSSIQAADQRGKFLEIHKSVALMGNP